MQRQCMGTEQSYQYDESIAVSSIITSIDEYIHNKYLTYPKKDLSY